MTRALPSSLIAAGAACLAFLIAYAAFITLVHAQGVAPEHAQRHAAIISYFDGMPFTGTPPAFLSAKEALHIGDVKRLLDAAFILQVLCFGTLVGISAGLWGKKEWREEWASRVLRAGGWTLVGVSCFLALASLLGFERLFYLFHAILFPQGNWIFPTDSTLIRMYPEAFFQRFASWWLGMVMLAGVLMALLGTVIERMRQEEKKFRQRHR